MATIKGMILVFILILARRSRRPREALGFGYKQRLGSKPEGMITGLKT